MQGLFKYTLDPEGLHSLKHPLPIALVTINSVAIS